MTTPTRATTAGRAYLDLRRKARQDRRPVDELLQLYVLECFLARLAATRFADQFVLKGGVLLAAFGERRPTRDVDLHANAISNDPAIVLATIKEIATIGQDDGVVFDTSTATAEAIRDEDRYPGTRVTMSAQLSTARPRFHADISVGDPIIPAPAEIAYPRVLGGQITIRSYPLAMIYAEKIVTAVSRGTTSTRWRDFADIHLLTRHHPTDGTELCTAISEVARHRATPLAPLSQALTGYAAIGQQRWDAWRRRQRLDDRLPAQFSDVIQAVITFADPAITGTATTQHWNPGHGTWS